jgi:ubiquinone/menaquinone biosynthesis C-methylase UbiE
MSDAAAMKAKEEKVWASVAPGWRTHDAFIAKASAPVSQRMLQLAGLTPGKRVLDIAAGTGEPAIPAARMVTPGGSVIATDFAEDMLAVAREKAARAGVKNVEFRRVDGEALDFADGSFDAVTIRFGIMFMPEPDTCLREVHRVLRPAGRVALATWATPDKNTWASIAAGILSKLANAPPPKPGAPGIFAFGDPNRLTVGLQAAGFRDAKVEPVEVLMADHNSADEYLDFLLEIAGPLAVLWSQLTSGQQDEARARISEQITGSDGRVKMTGTAWVATGQK